MRILVTRPRDDAAALVAVLAARGHETLVAPMLEIRAPAPGAARPDLAGVQALLFTSANGVRALAALVPERELPVFAVGDASARAARAAGFLRVESAGGDVADLARLVRERCEPAAGTLYHAAASRLAGDLKGALEAAGFALRRETLYESVAVSELPAELRAALAAGRLDAATFFSPRSAETFVALVRRAGLAAACTRLTAVCLSAPVAQALRPLDWRAVEIAAAPTQDSLLAALDRTVREASREASDDTATEADTIETMSDESSGQGAPPASGAESAKSQGPGAAQRVISQFGGIRPMAHKLGVAVSTVQGWRERGAIPAARHDQIAAAARTHGVELDTAALAASDRSGDTAPAAAAPAAAERRTNIPATKRTEAAATDPMAAEKSKQESAAATGGGAHGAPASARTLPSQAERMRTIRGGPAPVAAFLLGAAVLAVGMIVAVLARDAWLPLVGGGPAGDTGGGVASARVAAVESRVAALETTPAPGLPEAAQRRLDALTAQLVELDGRLAALGTADDALRRDLDAAVARLGAPDSLSAAEEKALGELRGELTALGERVGGLEATIASLSAERTRAAESAAGDLAAVLAVMQLRDALAGSAPFATELKTLQNLAKARDDLASAAGALEPLTDFAETGVPGLVALKAAFPAVARDVVAAEQAGAGDDWLAGVRRRLSSLITVRPLGAVAGESASALVARAEALLAQDDLAGAVAELAKLGGPPAAAAADWLTQARARVAAQAALVQLNAAVSARLTEARG